MASNGVTFEVARDSMSEGTEELFSNFPLLSKNINKITVTNLIHDKGIHT